jgi:tRNA(His) 5'-end guanylyltransferase
MLQTELEELTRKFKQIETESLEKSTLLDEQYLCIRLDGFKATKKYLRDSEINKEFNFAFHKATLDLYFSFRNYLTNEYPSSIICAIIFNDELSIIINKNNNASDSRKIMKLCTLFAGILSASFTNKFKDHKIKDNIISFDARPLILTENEISEYIRYRYLIATRYAYWKVLRLNNIKDHNEDYIKHNIDNCIKFCSEHQLKSKVKNILSTYKIYYPERTISPKFIVQRINSNYMIRKNIVIKIEKYLTYLNIL